MHVCPLQARAVLCSCCFKELSLTAATDSEAAAQPAGTWREDCASSPSQPGHAALRSQATHHCLCAARTCGAAPVCATDSEQMVWVQAQQRRAAGQGGGGGGTPVQLSAWRHRLLHGKVRVFCSVHGVRALQCSRSSRSLSPSAGADGFRLSCRGANRPPFQQRDGEHFWQNWSKPAPAHRPPHLHHQGGHIRLL